MNPSDLSPKKRILVAASELFYLQGYTSTGINQIIRESKTAKASFYDHFPSKENLAKEVIRLFSIQIHLWFRGILRTSNSPEEFIDNLEKKVLAQIKSKNVIYQGCPIAIFSTQFPKDDPVFSDSFSQAVRGWENLFFQFFQKLKFLKRIPKNLDVKFISLAWINIYEGALINWRISGNPIYIKMIKPSMLSIYKNHVLELRQRRSG